MSRRIALARVALRWVLITQRANGLVAFDARELDELVERMLSALLPALGLAELELDELVERMLSALLPALGLAELELGDVEAESHGARRTGGLA